MLELDCYIHASSWISPDTRVETGKSWRPAEPDDLSSHIPLMQRRRMSKIVRMGIASALDCKSQRPDLTPEAVTVGTAWGCVQDTEQFLKKMVTQDEQMLTPSAFIQSTHNTVAGQIALLTNCNGYNNTVSQGGLSFESAVLSAALYLNENPEHTILCGGLDELNDTSFYWMKRAGLFVEESLMPKAGEGAGFLLLNKNPEAARARLRGLHLFSNDQQQAQQELQEALGQFNASYSEDRLWLGLSTDSEVNGFFNGLSVEWNAPVHFFKTELCEWATVVAAAVAKASKEIQAAERVWLLNQFCGQRSLWLLESPTGR